MAQLRKDVEAQVAQARLAVVTAWERIGAAAANVTAARKSLESAEARFKAGLAIPIEVTDAQLTYYNAQLNATTALYDYFTALAALRNAVGLPTLSFENLREDRVLQP
jgi:outer membrane protein TolC